MVANDGVIFLWHFSKVSINDLFSTPGAKGSDPKKALRKNRTECDRRTRLKRPYTLPAYEQVVWYITYKDEVSVINEHNTTKSVYNWMAKTRKHDIKRCKNLGVTYEKVADDGVIFLWHFSKVSINDLFSHALIILAMTRAFQRYPIYWGPLDQSGSGSGHATTRARPRYN